MEDSRARRNFISNCLGILRATKGRGLVVSSEAKGVLGVRAPADVINLMAVWGLGREKGMESLSVNPRSVVVNERIKRTSFRGVVDVIEGGEREAEKNIQNRPQAKGQGANKGRGKRKVDDNEPTGAQILSKRQAKKLKLEALKVGKQFSTKDRNSSKDSPGEMGERSSPGELQSNANG